MIPYRVGGEWQSSLMHKHPDNVQGKAHEIPHQRPLNAFWDKSGLHGDGGDLHLCGQGGVNQRPSVGPWHYKRRVRGELLLID
jgi:hypothetical protein